MFAFKIRRGTPALNLENKSYFEKKSRGYEKYFKATPYNFCAVLSLNIG